MSKREQYSLIEKNPGEFIEGLFPDICDAVRLACILYKHYPGESEIEELGQEIIILLMEDDYRRLRQFAGRSSFKTWLNSVIKHHVSHQLRKRKKVQSLEGIALDPFICRPGQDEVFSLEEKNQMLQAAIIHLTKRERQLFELLYGEEASINEVAIRMGIKTTSVRRRKHALVRKLKRLVEVYLSTKDI